MKIDADIRNAAEDGQVMMALVQEVRELRRVLEGIWQDGVCVYPEQEGLAVRVVSSRE